MTHPPGTGGLLNAIRLAWITNWRVTLAFVLALVLSAVSFFTTLDGFVSYTAPDPNERGLDAWLLAAGATFGIQLVLLLSSWMVGTALVRAVQPHKTLSSRLGSIGNAGIWFLMFFLTLLVSVAFSYHTFYNRITAYYAPEEAGRANEAGVVQAPQAPKSTRSPHIENLALLYVRTTIEPLLGDMQKAAERRQRWYLDAFTLPKDRLDDEAKKIRASDNLESAYLDWVKYHEQMRSLADAVKKLVPGLRLRDDQQREAREKKEAERRDTEARRIAALARAGQNTDAAAKEVARLDPEIGSVEKEIDALQQSMRPFERQRDSAKEIMNCEKTGSEKCPKATGKPGKGPKYLAAKKDWDDAQLNIADKEQAITQAKQKLNDIKAQKADAQQIIAESKGTTVRFEQAPNSRPAAGDVLPITAPELEKLVEVIQGVLDSSTEPVDFGESGSTAAASVVGGGDTLESLRQACGSIQSRVLIPELQPYFERVGVTDAAAQARTIKCDRSGFEDAIKRVQGLNTGLRRFAERGCESLGGELVGKKTAEIIRHAEDCRGFLDLDPTFSNEIVETLSELRREHSIAVHPFVPSKLGLFQYKDDLAWFSLFVALMIDLLVFFAGIVGGHENLRRIDRIGEELRGDEALTFGLATLKEERPTDSEKIRYWRRLLRHFVLRELSPATVAALYPDLRLPVNKAGRSHIRYIGYIEEDQMLAGPDGGNSLLGTVQVWMCTPKSKIDLILRVPPDNDDPSRPRPGPFDPLPEIDEKPVRFYFLRELVLDIAEDIVNWDRAHARYRDAPIRHFDYVHGRRVRRSSREQQSQREPRLTLEENHLDLNSDTADGDVTTVHPDPNRRIWVRRPEPDA